MVKLRYSDNAIRELPGKSLDQNPNLVETGIF